MTSREQRERATSRAERDAVCSADAEYVPSFSFCEKHVPAVSLSRASSAKGHRTPVPETVIALSESTRSAAALGSRTRRPALSPERELGYPKQYSLIDKPLHGAVEFGRSSPNGERNPFGALGLRPHSALSTSSSSATNRSASRRNRSRPAATSSGHRCTYDEVISYGTTWEVSDQYLKLVSRHVPAVVIGGGGSGPTADRPGGRASLNQRLHDACARNRAPLQPKYDVLGGHGPAARSSSCTKPVTIPKTGRRWDDSDSESAAGGGGLQYSWHQLDVAKAYNFTRRRLGTALTAANSLGGASSRPDWWSGDDKPPPMRESRIRMRPRSAVGVGKST